MPLEQPVINMVFCIVTPDGNAGRSRLFAAIVADFSGAS
jgi:hypothetical protein